MDCNSRQEEILRQLCDEIGADLVDAEIIDRSGLWMSGDKIIVKDNMYLIVQNFLITAGPCCPLHYKWSTQVSTPYLTNDYFRYIEVRDPAIDREFIITGNDEKKVRRFFSNPKIKQLTLGLGKNRAEWNLEIINAGSLNSKLPERIYALRFMEYIDIIREVERLKSLLVLFKEMHDQLLIMDSADTDHPNIVFAY
jgi:hypothetical protein